MIECPQCGSEEAFCDGLRYVCPECGLKWPCAEIDSAENDRNDEEDY